MGKHALLRVVTMQLWIISLGIGLLHSKKMAKKLIWNEFFSDRTLPAKNKRSTSRHGMFLLRQIAVGGTELCYFLWTLARQKGYISDYFQIIFVCQIRILLRVIPDFPKESTLSNWNYSKVNFIIWGILGLPRIKHALGLANFGVERMMKEVEFSFLMCTVHPFLFFVPSTRVPCTVHTLRLACQTYSNRDRIDQTIRVYTCTLHALCTVHTPENARTIFYEGATGTLHHQFGKQDYHLGKRKVKVHGGTRVYTRWVLRWDRGNRRCGYVFMQSCRQWDQRADDHCG